MVKEAEEHPPCNRAMLGDPLTLVPLKRRHLGMMMELWRKFSNFFWKDSASPSMRSCPSAGRQGQQRSSASCSTSGPSPSLKRVSALLVGSFRPGGGGGQCCISISTPHPSCTGTRGLSPSLHHPW